MTASELTRAVLATRGSAQDEPRRTRLASAVTRAAIEAERQRATPRWTLRRAGDTTLIALDEGVDGQQLADYAEQLARVADRLAAIDPLPSPARVLEALQAVRAPESHPALAPARLVRLAAAASTRAAVSSRLEIYPRGMPAERVLKLAHGALLGAPELTVAQIHERVLARYPEAEPLPGRPALDGLLSATGSHLTWVAEAGQGRGAYLAPRIDAATFSSGSTPLPRAQTGDALPPRRHAGDRRRPLPGGAAPARRSRGSVPRPHGRAAPPRARRDRAGRPVRRGGLQPRGRADPAHEGRGAQERRRLDRRAARRRCHGREPRLAEPARPRPARPHHARSRTGGARPDAGPDPPWPPGSLWPGGLPRAAPRSRGRAVPRLARPRFMGSGCSSQRTRWAPCPVLDGQAIPVIGPSQWARLTSAWLANVHRAGSLSAELHPIVEVPR